MAKNTGQNIPELKQAGDELVIAIDNAVIYQKRGESLNRGGGLSIYYPFNLLKSKKGITDYQNYVAIDKLAPATQGALYGFFYENLSNVSLDMKDLKNVSVNVDKDKRTTWIELDEDEPESIEDVRAQILYIATFDGKIQGVFLGNDTGIMENSKEPGKFEGTFTGKWLRINGQLASMFVVSDATKRNKHGKKVDGTELLAIPVLVNNEYRTLFVSCKYPGEKFTVIGWTPTTDDSSGLPNGELNGFQKGDVVTPLYLEFAFSEEDREKLQELTEEQGKEFVAKNILNLLHGKPITIGYEPLKVEIGERPLPDGNYAYIFEFINPIGGEDVTVYEYAVFKIRKGKIVDVIHTNDLMELKDLS